MSKPSSSHRISERAHKFIDDHAHRSPSIVRIQSLLDTDLYKLTMQNAIFQLKDLGNSQVSYTFYNRRHGKHKSTDKAIELIRNSINALGQLSVTPAEIAWLSLNCPYLSKNYLEFLSKFRLDPRAAVTVAPASDGDVSITVKGTWLDTILYEVPVLAIVSEVYFKVVDKQWDYTGQIAQACTNASQLFQSHCSFSEFGTRRRRSYKGQDMVMQGILQAAKANPPGAKYFTGTSNVHFAMKYNLKPIGTMAHEFIMGISAKHNYNQPNTRVLLEWEKVYGPQALHVALPDTYSSDPFFREYIDPQNKPLAQRWTTLRQDSGDPAEFVRKAVKAWTAVGANLARCTVLFSDGLDVPTCIKLKEVATNAGVKAAFGIGTSLTNSYRKSVRGNKPSRSSSDGTGAINTTGEKSQAMSIVMKLSTIDQQACVKISDETGKHTGDRQIARAVAKKLQVGTPFDG